MVRTGTDKCWKGSCLKKKQKTDYNHKVEDYSLEGYTGDNISSQ